MLCYALQSVRTVQFSERGNLRLSEEEFATFCDYYPAAPDQSGGGVEGSAPGLWYGRGPSNRPDADLAQFGSGMSRSRLLQLDADVPTLELCIATLAWGGMRGGNRNTLFNKSPSAWLGVAERVREGQLTRGKAFDAFANVHRSGKSPGMGPAYYTKLIYFLMPRVPANPAGYIMDQWLGCSINLLFGQEVVLMNHTTTWTRQRSGKLKNDVSSQVSPLNTSTNYERFCQALELLATRLGAGWTADQVELALLSKGGHRPAAWRKHVKGARSLTLLGAD